jgi:hypothetical protein
MSPLLQAALASILRAVLMLGAGWLVEHNVWTNGNADLYVTAAAMAIVSYGWALWTHYRARIKFLTALESPPGTTEKHIDTKISEGKGATL